MLKIIDITTAKNAPMAMQITTQVSYSHDHWFTKKRKDTVIPFKRKDTQFDEKKCQKEMS